MGNLSDVLILCLLYGRSTTHISWQQLMPWLGTLGTGGLDSRLFVHLQHQQVRAMRLGLPCSCSNTTPGLR
jgi:hypothetical protein